jgi:hypothetical protein
MSHAKFENDGHGPLVFTVNPSYPGELRLDSGTVMAATEGGDVYAAKKASSSVGYALRFDGMPKSDYDGGYDYDTGTQDANTQCLINWFLNVAPPGAAEFTYTDPFGSAHTVSFADGALDMKLTDEGEYAGVIRLRKELG